MSEANSGDEGYTLVEITATFLFLTSLCLLVYNFITAPLLSDTHDRRVTSKIQKEYKDLATMGYRPEGTNAVWVKGQDTEKCAKFEYGIIEDDDRKGVFHTTVELKKCDGQILLPKSKIIGTTHFKSFYEEHYPTFKTKQSENSSFTSQ